MNFNEIFEKYKTIAVYGMSKNSSKPSNTVPVFFMQNGYSIIPVNPTADEIEGKKCYSSLGDIPDKIDILNVFRPSEQAFAIVEEAVERKMVKGDIKLIWLQMGIVSDDARELAENQGIEFVQDKCMFQEYNKLH